MSLQDSTSPAPFGAGEIRPSGQVPVPASQAKPAFNVYNTMLIVSFAAICIAVLLMYLEGRRYDWDVRAKGAGAVGAGAPTPTGTPPATLPAGGAQPPAEAGQPAAGEQAPAGTPPAGTPPAGAQPAGQQPPAGS